MRGPLKKSQKFEERIRALGIRFENEAEGISNFSNDPQKFSNFASRMRVALSRIFTTLVPNPTNPKLMRLKIKKYKMRK